MKYPFVLTLIACVTLVAAGQTPSGSTAESKCTLTPEQAPEIRGVRLGMSAEQLQSLFPGEANRQSINNAISASKQAGAYGLANTELRPDREAANPRFAGVNYISIGLLDERVVRFYIAYTQVEWKSVDQFVTRLSEGLRLPNVSWEANGQLSVLQCNGFNVEAYASRGSADSLVRVTDTSVNKIVEDRREVEREKARQVFKP